VSPALPLPLVLLKLANPGSPGKWQLKRRECKGSITNSNVVIMPQQVMMYHVAEVAMRASRVGHINLN